MSKQYLVFCSGPITDLNFDSATNWRNVVRNKMPLNIKAVSPLRCKEYLCHEKKIADSYEDIPLSSEKGITTRDRNDVMRCDLLFVNLLGTEKVSIGTVMEIAWADMLRKPIVLVMDKNNIHDHAMIRCCSGFIVSSLDEGIEITKAILST